MMGKKLGINEQINGEKWDENFYAFFQQQFVLM